MPDPIDAHPVSMIFNSIPSELQITAAGQDVLGFEQQAETFSHIVARATAPFTFGVIGPWGSGKTSFLELLRPKLQRTAGHVIWFDAWKYSACDNLILPLFAHMLQFSVGTPFRQDGLELLANLGRVTKPVWSKVLALDEWAKHTGIAAEIETWTKGAENVHRRFEEFIAATRKARNDVPFYVLIDDLDRCGPDQALVLLEQMRVFCYSSEVVFVLALSAESLQHAIEARYGNRLDLVQDYSQKLITYELELVHREDGYAFILDSLLRSAGAQPNDECKRLLGQIVDAFKESGLKNVRLLKRMLIRALVGFEAFSDRTDQEQKSNELAHLIVLKHGFPSLLHAMISNPSFPGRAGTALRGSPGKGNADWERLTPGEQALVEATKPPHLFLNNLQGALGDPAMSLFRNPDNLERLKVVLAFL